MGCIFAPLHNGRVKSSSLSAHELQSLRFCPLHKGRIASSVESLHKGFKACVYALWTMDERKLSLLPAHGLQSLRFRPLHNGREKVRFVASTWASKPAPTWGITAAHCLQVPTQFYIRYFQHICRVTQRRGNTNSVLVLCEALKNPSQAPNKCHSALEQVIITYRRGNLLIDNL